MPVAQINGVNINYAIAGERGPFVALTPGGRREYQEIEPLARLIAAEGYRVVLHDRRNCGASDLFVEGDKPESSLWVDDLHALLKQLGALPAFISGSSSGARLSLQFAVRYPLAVRGLLLMRVSAGETAARLLPDAYFDQHIRAAQSGGMAAVCALEHWRDRIAANPAGRDYLMKLDPQDFIATLQRWRADFVRGALLPVAGLTEAELRSIAAPAIIVPGNDRVHLSRNGDIARRLIGNSELHRLPLADVELDSLPIDEWRKHDPDIARVYVGFMRRVAEKAAA